MRTVLKLAGLAGLVAWSLGVAFAQDLAPRAYIITPIHSNAVTLTYSFSGGSILLEGAAPITDASGKINTSVVSYFHTLSFFGRSANITASLPYGVGNFQGKVRGTEATAYRSGLQDAGFRFSVNLLGGPAMDTKNFLRWRQKTVLGASLKVIAPTGQYDPTKALNFSANRWAFKPELGYSRRWGGWVLDAYGAVWLFTTNPEYFSHTRYSPGTNTRSQRPIGAFEGHLSYDFKPRLWASLDVNYWIGGRTSLNGVENPNTLQENSRVGATFSVPVSKHQSLKFNYSDGAYIHFGGDFHNVSVAWQYSWLGRPN